MITYIKGDLFNYLYKDKSNKMICHIVNDLKAWGSGFVIPLGEKFPRARESYLKQDVLKLGSCQFIEYDNIYIMNMVAQHGIISSNNLKPIRYRALVECMSNVLFACQTRHIDEIHAPAFGSCRSGGNWAFISELIEEIWCQNNLRVNIYYLDDNQKVELKIT
jgi:hypothetical protein